MKIPKFDIKIIGDINTYLINTFIDECENKKNINVFLHSSGGDSETAWFIVNYLKAKKINMNIYCSRCESAANIILSAAKNKFSFKHCSFMYHLGVAGEGKLEEYEKHKKKTNYFNELYRKITPKNIELTHTPYYLTSKEALQEGLIDKII